jgi:hypothetical protein
MPSTELLDLNASLATSGKLSSHQICSNFGDNRGEEERGRSPEPQPDILIFNLLEFYDVCRLARTNENRHP